MKTTILFLLSAICAVAQTNIVTTNQPVTLTTKTNKPANLQPRIVTKEMVLQGLKTLDGQIAALKKKQSELEDQIYLPSQKAQLQYEAGTISGAECNQITQACQHQWALTCNQVSQQIAAIKLQQLEIRQRYAQLLKPE